MQPHTQTYRLSLILLASLIEYTNALPQTVQARPAIVVDRDQSNVSPTMKWIQGNLFYVCLGIGILLFIIETVDEADTTGFVIVVVGWFWMKKRKNDKARKITANAESSQTSRGQPEIEMEQERRERAESEGFMGIMRMIGIGSRSRKEMPIR
jgi:hypothetical protein